jgi:hypothetical protein
MAKKMELEIPMPLIFGNLRGIETVLIDNLDCIARKLIKEKLGTTKLE